MRLQIFIKTQTGSTIELFAFASDTILKIKEYILSKEAIPIEL